MTLPTPLRHYNMRTNLFRLKNNLKLAPTIGRGNVITSRRRHTHTARPRHSHPLPPRKKNGNPRPPVNNHRHRVRRRKYFQFVSTDSGASVRDFLATHPSRGGRRFINAPRPRTVWLGVGDTKFDIRTYLKIENRLIRTFCDGPCPEDPVRTPQWCVSGCVSCFTARTRPGVRLEYRISLNFVVRRTSRTVTLRYSPAG